MHWETLTAELSPERRHRLLDEAGPILLSLTENRPGDRSRLPALARTALEEAAGRMRMVPPTDTQLDELVRALLSRAGGLGFLEQLMPPVCNRYTDLVLNPSGQLWARARGDMDFTHLADQTPSHQEVWQAIESLLGPLGRACTEASPSVDARMPRDAASGFAGARLKVLHPAIVPGDGYPSLALRFFEPNPVDPQQLLAWNMLPETVLAQLLEAVGNRINILVVGGTGTGKTTLLSALCHGIPKSARIVKIEDPEELWLPHPNVATLEARPAPPGSSIPGYTVTDGVDDAMRMAPSHILVGEVRTGDAALSLFRAFMSDHSGLATFHANGPLETLVRLGVIMFADAGVPFEASRTMFVQAIQQVVHIGFTEGRRRVLGVYDVRQETGATHDVCFEPIWQSEHADPIPRLSISPATAPKSKAPRKTASGKTTRRTASTRKKRAAAPAADATVTDPTGTREQA